MQYRFRVSKKRRPPRHPQRPLRLRGEDTLRRKAPLPEPVEEIDFYDLGESSKKSTPNGFTVFWRKLRAILRQIGAGFARLGRKLRNGFQAVRERLRRPPRPKLIHALPVLSGALCAALLVSAVSAGGVLLGLFSGYGRAFDSVTVPNFVGKEPDAVLSQQETRLNLIIQYVENPNVQPGLVISQSPHAGVTRRIYGKDSYCNVVLTVSAPQEPYRLEDLRGKNQRDAALILRNAGLSATVTEEYSDTVRKGTVLGTEPQAGIALSQGDSVVLRVSLGKQVLRASVPDLFGLGESDANSLLRSAGFVPGAVSYQTSSYPVGTIIAQSDAAHTVLEEGSVISYTVSAGDRYAMRTVPDLYGMSLSNAADKLREVGLVIESTYPVAHAAPRGTVISQFPAPGAPITSSTVSVTLYVSS